MRSTTEFQGAIGTKSAVQAATSPAVHSAQINSPTCTPLNQSQDPALGGGVVAQAEDAPDVSGGRTQSVAITALGTIQP